MREFCHPKLIGVLTTFFLPLLLQFYVAKTHFHGPVISFLILGAFVVSWTPYSVVSLITVFGDPSTIPRTAAMVPALFAKSSVIWNPIIYVARHNDFRRVCLKILSGCCVLDKIRKSARSNSSSTSPNLTAELLVEDSRKPSSGKTRVLEHQIASSISSPDSTTINGSQTGKNTITLSL